MALVLTYQIFSTLIFSLFVSCIKTRNSDLKLQGVYILFRHGRRTPILDKLLFKNVSWNKWEVEEDLPHTIVDYEIFNIDGTKKRPTPEIDNHYERLGSLPGGANRGKLTVFGQIDSYYLGLRLKRLYLDYFNNEFVGFHYKNISLYSTNYDRTLKTIRCVLAGMFSSSQGSKIFSIFTSPHNLEIKSPNYRYCESYKQIHQKLLKNISNNLILSSFRKELAEKLKFDIKIMPSVDKLWEEIIAIKSRFNHLPEIYEHNLKIIERSALAHHIYLYSSNPFSIRYACGALLNTIYNHLHFSVQNSQFIFHLDSIHDSTIICLLRALGFEPTNWPDFSSFLGFELYTDSKGNPYIALNYNEQNINYLTENLMSLKEFLQKIKPVLIDTASLHELCQNQKDL